MTVEVSKNETNIEAPIDQINETLKSQNSNETIIEKEEPIE